jgi:8-oxo-dGTP diphosphatase
MESSRVSVAGIAMEGGRLFIARRKQGGDLGGKWEFPGGKVEPGERDEETLVREYEEELALPIEVGPFLSSVSFTHRGKEYVLHAYRITFRKKVFTLRMHSEWKWASLEEMEQMDFADSDRKLFPAIRKAAGP